MKKNGILLRHGLWIVFPAILYTATVLFVMNVNVPLIKTCVREATLLVHHYTKRRDAATYPTRLKTLQKDITCLDSLCTDIQKRKDRMQGTFTDELYRHADAAGFRPTKVESGLPVQSNGVTETSMVIEGKGTYAATGKFIEMVENSFRPVRIRQCTIKQNENGIPDVFIDVTVRNRHDAFDGKNTKAR